MEAKEVPPGKAAFFAPLNMTNPRAKCQNLGGWMLGASSEQPSFETAATGALQSRHASSFPDGEVGRCPACTCGAYYDQASWKWFKLSCFHDICQFWDSAVTCRFFPLDLSPRAVQVEGLCCFAACGNNRAANSKLVSLHCSAHIIDMPPPRLPLEVADAEGLLTHGCAQTKGCTVGKNKNKSTRFFMVGTNWSKFVGSFGGWGAPMLFAYLPGFHGEFSCQWILSNQHAINIYLYWVDTCFGSLLVWRWPDIARDLKACKCKTVWNI